MRQLELPCAREVRPRSTPPVTPPAPLPLEEEEMRELLRLMARAFLAVVKRKAEVADER
jgi:hypothetical protein